MHSNYFAIHSEQLSAGTSDFFFSFFLEWLTHSCPNFAPAVMSLAQTIFKQSLEQ